MLNFEGQCYSFLYKWEELLEKSIYFCFTLISFVIEIFIYFFINVIFNICATVRKANLSPGLEFCYSLESSTNLLLFYVCVCVY